MELLLFDLVAGLFIRLLVMLAVWCARLIFRGLRALTIEHPGVGAVLVIAAIRYEWITWEPALQWGPLVAGVLVLMALLRFLSDHPPAEIRRTVEREAKRIGQFAAPVTAARGWFHRSDGQPETHGRPSVIDEGGQGLTDAFNGATPNGTARPGSAPPPPPESPVSSAAPAPAGGVIDVQEARRIAVGPVTTNGATS